ncbi:hypothetical protein [Micromonospora sp. RTP1Z1]|uniref:hypothetical protein n=1 Tax=Micromonospora sp. RTP1Z1 TaxID=2994043 RepID=UPI0029C78BC4|nr:hypothetical protein [Micromonospora sp. RTP1Z1]
MPRPEYFDFGLTGFARRFHQDWRYDGSPWKQLDRMLGPEHEPVGVEELRRDAAQSLAGLTNGEIEALWVAGTDGNFPFGPDGAWSTGSDWMRTIVQRCDQWYRETGRTPLSRPAPGAGLADAVTREVTLLSASVLERLDPDGRVTAALLRCVRACSPDLAFRWSLRIARRSHLALEASQYARLVRLGEQFKYGEYIVSDLDDLVE